MKFKSLLFTQSEFNQNFKKIIPISDIEIQDNAAQSKNGVKLINYLKTIAISSRQESLIYFYNNKLDIISADTVAAKYIHSNGGQAQNNNSVFQQI